MNTLAQELSHELVEAAVCHCQFYLSDKHWLAKNREVAPDLSYVQWQVLGRDKLAMPELERLAAIVKTYGWHAAFVRPVFHNPETNWELTVVHKEKVGAPADSAA